MIHYPIASGRSSSEILGGQFPHAKLWSGSSKKPPTVLYEQE